MSDNDHDCIKAEISLGVDDKTRHWTYFYPTPRTDAERQKSLHKTDFGGTIVQKTVEVRNGRNNSDLTLDSASFELVKECPTALATEDFYAIQDPLHPKSEELMEKYYAEVKDFVKKRLKCDEVIVFHHQVRCASKMDKTGVQSYAGFAPHTDSSSVSGDEQAITLLEMNQGTGNEDTDTEKKEKKYERYMNLNIWRNISDDHPIVNDHLAVLDERSTVKPDDYIIKDLFMQGHESVQYNLNARHTDHHKWYYFPKMTKNEALLIKNMDSDFTKSGRICFHMSVNDGTMNNNKINPPPPPRESIETRMVCYWTKADSGIDSMPTRENTNMDLAQSPYQLANGGGEGGGASLHSASPWQLLTALVSRPFLSLMKKMGINLLEDGASNAKSTYSGNPEDYLEKFMDIYNKYDQWPSVSKTWAGMEMKKVETAESGIRVITKACVGDEWGIMQTKAFTADEKEAIVNYLMNNSDYINLAKETLKEYITE